MTRRAPRRKVYVMEASMHPDPLEVVKSLVNGLDISLVDPHLYSSLVPHIKSYQQRYQDKKDEGAIQRLEWILQYIDEFPQREQISKSLSPRNRYARTSKPPALSGADLNDEIENILLGIKTRRTYTRDERQCIIGGLRKRKARLLDDEEYVEAEHCEKTTQAFIAKAEFSDAFAMTNERVNDLTVKLQEAQDQYDDLKSRWSVIRHNFEDAREADLRDLRDELDIEINDVHQMMEEEPDPRFCKFSTQVILNRKKEHALVSARRYIEAEAVKKENEEQMARETEVHMDRWLTFCEDKLQKTIVKANEAYRIREAKLAREGATMRKAEKIELESARKKIEHVEYLIKSANQLVGLMESTSSVTRTVRASTAPTTARSPRSSRCKTSQLPPIGVYEDSNPVDPATFRQRAILNHRLYTKTRPTKSCKTAR